MELNINVYQKDHEILCQLGPDQHEGIVGVGSSVMEALLDFSTKMEAALHGHHYASQELIEQIVALNCSVEDCKPPVQEEPL